MDSFREVIKNFSPSWFAMVMGTGVYATSTGVLYYIIHLSFLVIFSQWLVFINFVMFSAILVPFLWKLLFYPNEVKRDFKNPLQANFYVMFGIALLSLAANFSIVNPVGILYISFWFFGTLAVVIIEMYILTISFLGKHIEIQHINPSWFLGTTGLLLVPGTGFMVVMVPQLHDLSLFLFDFSFGAGFFLYIALFSIWIYRFILHEPLKNYRIPLFWINLGPIGAFLMSLIVHYHYSVGLEGVSMFFAMLLMGSGVWWFIMALIITLYYLGHINIPYKTAWWSFTFPLGQFLIGVNLFNSVYHNSTITLFVVFLYLLLSVFWITNIFMMIHSLLREGIMAVQGID